MIEHFVTLFDSLFLPQGLALHASMERHAGPYHLWILCMDETAHAMLTALALPNVRLLRLGDWEDETLRRVRATRSPREYCWTLTPFAPQFVFATDPAAARVTYLDADTWFCRSPSRIFADFANSGAAALITEHGFAPEYDQTRFSGRYCVQFMTFVRGRSDHIREWWADRCLEWCHDRTEEGKFGDQMYLNDWTTRFGSEVHVLPQLENMQAPWNTYRFRPGDAVLYHFHGVRLLPHERLLLTDHYRINPLTARMLYTAYAMDLRHAVSVLGSHGHVPKPQLECNVTYLWLRLILRRMWTRAAGRSARWIISLPAPG